MKYVLGPSLIFLLIVVGVESFEDDDFELYTASVFEHARVGDLKTDSIHQIIEKNLEIYSLAAETASKKGADIIVFPDYGLFPKMKNRSENLPALESIPYPSQDEPLHPCEQETLHQNRTILRTLSCIARDNNITIVAGMGGIEPCIPVNDTECPSDGAYQLNAHVAFDRKGYLVARYYKEHLFFEPAYDVSPFPQYSVFATDFGTVAIVSSFDILFSNSIGVVEEHSPENVAFPTLWFDELPYFSSIQVQEMFAVRMEVNVLAANLNIPRRSALGSGIYSSGQGASRYTYNPDSLSKLIIARIPRIPGRPFHDGQSQVLVLKNNEFSEAVEEDGESVPDVCSKNILEPSSSDSEYRCNERNLDNYTLKKLEKPSGSLTTCDGDTCCTLSYKTKDDDLTEDYYLATYRGVISIKGRYNLSVEICSVVRCDPLEEKECATFPLKAKTVFSELSLSGDFHTPYVFPSIVNSGQRLSFSIEREFKLNTQDAPRQNHTKGELISKSGKPLLIASLFGRHYENDPTYYP